ncbi:UPF0182 family membrane protein [Micrococcoides hystricis]|uniref:UPF0182 protein ACFFFR_02985 n=1 Tax=Micrococcoides hystricis TaxID=1572761 RepID=A0ABV6P899_9MICC
MSFGQSFSFGSGGRASGDGGSKPPGGSRPTGDNGGEKRSSKPSVLTLTVVILALLIGAFVMASGYYADILWFTQLGYEEVFWTSLVARIVIFLIAFAIMAGGVWASMSVAYRKRPVYSPGQMQDNLQRYQEQLAPLRRLIFIAAPLVLGVFAGTAMASSWQQVLLFINQEPFGQTDPEFGLDFSFYLNTLPFLKLLVGYLIAVTVIAGIAGILTHYIYGGIRITEQGKLVIAKAARIHIAVIALVFLLLQAATFWFDRYSTMLNQNERWAGAMYTDVHAVIPTKTILAIAAIIVGLLFIWTIMRNNWRIPLIGTAMLLITVLVAGGLYPMLIQQYQVNPTEKALEADYIQRNIDMTRFAYGMHELETDEYDAEVSAKRGALAKESENTKNIRILDPNLVTDAFGQLQQFRQYYTFPQVLAVDRYEIDGEVNDVVVAAREVTVDNQDSWVNQHITYTHGYGLVVAHTNQVTGKGAPDFLLEDIPTQGILGDDSTYEPRIYFGQNSPLYSVVGAPEGAEPRELDRPQTADQEVDTTYTFSGDGGPSVGNLLNRLVYAIKFQSTDLLLSQEVNEESQILYDRHPADRVKKVAPYLEIDSTVYPAIIDGRVKWIVDGYTTSNNFPYSKGEQLGAAIRDSLTREDPTRAGEINYIRNAVKATVDAYDGSVELYAWDDEDPILKAWQKTFPSTLKPYSEMSGELMSHVRYPEDMFKVQRELLGRYHVDRPASFYDNDDAWSVPADPTVKEGTTKVPPYYMSLQMPGSDKASFSLTTTYIPRRVEGQGRNRNVLYGFLSANGDAGNKAGEKADTYGQLSLLELPRNTTISGPGQVQADFDSQPVVSRELNLLRQGASNVTNGNLITLPVGGGILYVQPVYVRSTGGDSYPLLRKVLVSYGNQIGFADSLSEALDQVFEGASGAVTADGDGADGTEQTGGEDAAPGADQTNEQKLSRALRDANDAIQEGQEALAENDFTKYGQAQQKLTRAIEDAIEAENAINGTTEAPEEPVEEQPAEENTDN